MHKNIARGNGPGPKTSLKRNLQFLSASVKPAEISQILSVADLRMYDCSKYLHGSKEPSYIFDRAYTQIVFFVAQKQRARIQDASSGINAGPDFIRVSFLFYNQSRAALYIPINLD